jgi:predicted CxxxxCH...CXXCH cytochrome family protein
VIIESDPASLAEFRSRVGPVVVGGCAAVGCHSSATAAGGFGLFTHDDSPRAWYTNFYILQTWQQQAIVPGGASIAMIDRIHPEESLLAQYGLPLALAAPAHPALAKFRPAFPSRMEPHYQALIRWMGFLLRPEGGRYADIHYQPPWVTAFPKVPQPLH